MPVILTFFNTNALYSRCEAHTQSNRQWCDFSWSCDQGQNHKKGL